MQDTHNITEDFGGIRGLTYIREFVSPQEEKKILRFLDTKGKWDNFAFSSRQTQQYGYFYDFFTEALTPTVGVPKVLRGVTNRMEKKGVMTIQGITCIFDC